MMRFTLGVGALVMLASGCEVTTPPPPARIGGAQFITFRCAPRTSLPAEGFPALGGPGAPLDACGCTQYLDDGMLGALDVVGCALGNAEARAYVAGSVVGEVGVVRLNRGAATGEARILDSDETVPGVTGIFVDDIVSDLEADPTGRFVLSVNATSGTLGVIVDDFDIQPEMVIDLGLGPLASIAVWPPIDRGLERADDRFVLPQIRRAWVTAPTARRIVELDLVRLAAVLDGQASPGEDLVTRIYDMPGEGVPAVIAVHPDGQRIYVGHAATPAITEFDVETGEATRRIDLGRRSDCADGYLINLTSRDRDQSCGDGYDNDGDGVSDQDDPDCVGPFGSEWAEPACPQTAECADGVDNNGDGLVDRDDPSCAAGDGRWEGDPPACANGLDDDGDGQIDREDLGCESEGDRDELPMGNGLESGDQCLDGLDNDGDGLIDIAEDPGCSDEINAAARYREERPAACADGLDNDGDGKIDFAGGDGDCFAASDDAEGASRIELGPRHVVTARFVINGRRFDYLYTTEAVGYMVSVDLDEEVLRPRYTGLDRTATQMALRQRGDANTVLTIASDGSLRGLQITAPAPLRTADGRDVFARFGGVYPVVRYDTGETATRARFEHAGVQVQAFYTIEDGVAARVTALDDACPPIVPSDEGGCPAGFEEAGAACQPTTCAAQADCPGAHECLGGACIRSCSADADCEDAQLCDPTTLADGTTRTVCRSRCRIDDRGLVAVAPPRDPCAGGMCGAECEDDAGCGPDLVCAGGLCESWCRAERCEAPFDAESAPLVEPGPASLGDPLVMRADRDRIAHDEVNVRTLAHERVPQVTGPPRLFVRNSQVTVDFERYAALCRIPQPAGTAVAPDWPAGDCIPAGKTIADGGGLVAQTDQERDEEVRYRVDGYPYLQVLEDHPGRIPSQAFSLLYEGVLPRSESQTGQYAGPIDVPMVIDGAPTEVPGWILVDYDQDFCSAGVEAGDVLIVDRMVPLDAEDEDCAPFVEANLALSPEQRRDPLRYRVAEVAPFKLVLRPDLTPTGGSTSYRNMLRRDDRQPAPELAEARPAPPAKCMSGLTTYRVRVGESFILLGERSGYRHPWVRRGATCVEDPQRAGRHSRVQLGVPFENEWFRFQLGPADPALLADDPDATLPYLVDTIVAFEVDGGESINRLSNTFTPNPQDMRWLPTNDLLYIVDGTVQTLVEIANLDMLRQIPVVTNDSYD